MNFQNLTSSALATIGSKDAISNAAIAVVMSLAAGSAFAHGMGGMGHMGSGPHTTSLSQTKTPMTTKTGDHWRDRHFRRFRFFSFGYGPEGVCYYRHTFHGVVRICPID